MRRSASPSFAPTFDQPISTPNITPLIDVMLVLLIVFILAIPAMTHKVTVDLPVGRPFPGPDRQVTHRLLLAPNGVASYDGTAMDDATLGARLRAMNADANAVLVMKTEPETRYERFDQVLAVVKRAGVTRLGFEGNEGLVRSF